MYSPITVSNLDRLFYEDIRVQKPFYLRNIQIVNITFDRFPMKDVERFRGFFIHNQFFVKENNYDDCSINGSLFGSIFTNNFRYFQRIDWGCERMSTVHYTWHPSCFESNICTRFYRGTQSLVSTIQSYPDMFLPNYFGDLRTFYYDEKTNWFRAFLEYFWCAIIVHETNEEDFAPAA